jgi:hypothetical protein
MDYLYQHKDDSTDLLKKEIDINKYYNFAKFYNLTSNITLDTIMKVYNLMIDSTNIKISYIANECNISNDEVVVVVLYLEYLNFLREKAINMNNDMITNFTMNDKTMFDKYINFIRNKTDYQTIVNNMGHQAIDELNYINNYYVIEGIRIIDKKIYYAGDYNV